MNISRLQPVFSETWVKSLKTSVKLHLHQPREPVQNIRTELCEAGPDRRTALHEAKEASAGERPDNHRTNELRAARETPVINQLILLMEKPRPRRNSLKVPRLSLSHLPSL